jgi:hypothetical protein
MVYLVSIQLFRRDLEGVIWLCDESGASKRQFFGGSERQEATNQ